RPTRPKRVPVVLTREEVARVLAELHGAQRIVASLLYGAGLRLLEALHLRVKDVLLQRREIVVRGGKGGHDRLTMLPDSLQNMLRRQLEHVAAQHTRDLAQGKGWVALPTSLA